MKILVTGSAGQVGWELQRAKPEGVTLLAMSRAELDITDRAQVAAVIAEARPDWVINASAYTAVDKAESEPELAAAINAEGAGNLAEAAREQGARLVQISTDFIFDGSHSTPYQSSDSTCPLGVYGATKLAGERQVQSVFGDDALIIRTAWVYSAHGHNFVKTMLRLMAERDTLSVVQDQVGTPTWAAELARVIYLAIAQSCRGVFNWTDAGVASWYDFAVAIEQLGREVGLLSRPTGIHPIPASAYPTPATRPAYSVLDKDSLREAINYTGLHWRVALEQMLKEVQHG